MNLNQTNTLRKILADLTSQLQRCKESGIQVQSGILYDEAVLIAEKVMFQPPADFLEWTILCNGLSGGSIDQVFGLDNVLVDCMNSPEMNWLELNWFPIASDGCGSYYAIVPMNHSDGTTRHPVVFLDHEQSQDKLCDTITCIVASDFYHFISTVIENCVQICECVIDGIDYDDDTSILIPFHDEKKVLLNDPTINTFGLPLPWNVP